MRELEVVAHVPAAPDRVWAVLCDHAGWQAWAGIHEAVLRLPGDPPPNGIGARCVLRRSGVAVEEEITEFEPPRRLAARILGGAPLREGTSEIELRGAGDLTEVRWRVRFRPLLPLTGPLVDRVVRSTLESILARLGQRDWAAEAQKERGGSAGQGSPPKSL